MVVIVSRAFSHWDHEDTVAVDTKLDRQCSFDISLTAYLFTIVKSDSLQSWIIISATVAFCL